MKILGFKRFPKLLIICTVFLLLFGIWVYLLYFGVPSNQKPSIPPYRGLININKIEPHDDLQSILSYKLEEKGNAADFYVKALQSFDSSIFLTPPSSLWTNGVYNPNYKDIDLIVKGAKFKNCTFPADIYYSSNTADYHWMLWYKWKDLIEATLTRGTVLINEGKNEQAVDCFEAVIVFGKQLEDARLSYDHTGQSESYISEGMSPLISYYQKQGKKRNAQKCEDFLKAEMTFEKSWYSVLRTIAPSMIDYDFTPRIPPIPSIMMNQTPAYSVDTVIEYALYHNEPTCRIVAINYLGACKKVITQHIIGMPITDNAKQNQIIFVLQYIENNDPDPLIRYYATRALNPKKALNRFEIVR